jgi:hypothetical protein
MNPKATWFWTVVAAGLFAFIFLFERRLHKPPAPLQSILPNLKPAAITGVQILPKAQPEIRLERTNDTWVVTQPFQYPAQSALVQALLTVLTHLAPADRITAAELKHLRHADAQYGFEPPQTTLVLQHDDDQTFIHVGYKTGPGDQLFLQVVGVGEVYVVDAALLKLIPLEPDAWRDTTLVDLRTITFDRLIVTNAGKAPVELQRNPTNRLWRMILPGWEPRADSDKVEAALQRLQSMRVDQWVTDDPKADLDAYGLQTPDISLALQQGTNNVVLLEFGKNPTNDPKQVYARRGDQSAVVTVSADSLAPWRSPADFRDRHLVTLTGPLNVLEVRAADQFRVLREPTNGWRVLPQSAPAFPADAGLVGRFITNLSDLQVAEFVKDVVTAPDLPARGLAVPRCQIILETTLTNLPAGPTNLVLDQLDFGTNQNDEIFVRRADESALYTVKLADFQRLPSASWQLRDRRIWDFAGNEVARLIVQQSGMTRALRHNGTNSWSVEAPGQGMLNDLALEELAHRLGELSAWVWVERGLSDPAQYGFKPDDYRLTVELRDGRKLEVEIGGMAPSGFPYATTVLDGEPWVFEFPPDLFQFVQLYLPVRQSLP